ncbi:MAG: hypothetical protein R3D25_01780 [Geminicoccaceae bacterium]
MLFVAAGGSTLAPLLLSPKVAQGAEYGWIGVFLATLTWSLGCAIAVYWIKRYDLHGYQMLAALSSSLLVALAIASGIGFGTLDPTESFSSVQALQHPLAKIPASFVLAAFYTYGPVGTFLGAFIGSWVGYRVAQRSHLIQHRRTRG